MNKTRVAYLDTAKAYLIFLVILGHVLIVLNPRYDKLYFVVIQAFIYTFHMPAFFIIHGILSDNEKCQNVSIIEFIKRRFYSLMAPYLFFEVVGLIWKVIFLHQSFYNGFYNLITIRCNVGADWFLPAMFMGDLLFLAYAKHLNSIYGTISIISCFILPIFMAKYQLTIVLGRGLLAYGFIMIGNVGKKLFCSEKTKNILGLMASFVVTASVAIINIKFGGNDFYNCTINNPFLMVIGGISGTMLILGVSHILQCKRITYIGNHTLAIMGTHQLIIYAFTTLVPGVYEGNIMKGLFLLFAILVFEIPVVCLDNQFQSVGVERKMK